MALRVKKKAVFLDKDGTLIENVPHNTDIRHVRLYRAVPEALLRLGEEGFALLVVTNQPGVALGYFNENDVLKVGDYLTGLLAEKGVRLEGFYYCPHHPEGIIKKYATVCTCRKPMPGLLQRAAAELDIDLSNSWMLGDILHDVEAGNRAGCRSILIDNGNETEWLAGKYRQPYAIVKNIGAAVDTILGKRAAVKEGGAHERAIYPAHQ